MHSSQSAVDMTEGRINELISISRINVICLVWFLIPCGINIVREIKYRKTGD